VTNPARERAPTTPTNRVPPLGFQAIVLSPVITDGGHRAPPSPDSVLLTWFEPEDTRPQTNGSVLDDTTSGERYSDPTDRPGHDLTPGIDHRSHR
jgi:hypothetical protein